MQVEIRMITDIKNENGKLLDIIKVETKDISKAIHEVGAAMIDHAKKQWGDDAKPKTDESIFGGYMANSRGDVIVAR